MLSINTLVLTEGRMLQLDEETCAALLHLRQKVSTVVELRVIYSEIVD